MSADRARELHWTEEEYLRMEADSPIKHEYFDGEIYGMAGAGSRHNVVAMNTGAALVNLVSGGPCHVFNSDQRIRVQDPKRFYTYADGGVACGQWQVSEKDGMSLENPVLLFEVLSPSTRDYDRGAKLALYQRIPSLVDVLLVDQPAQLVEHLRREADGWRRTEHREGVISVLRGAIELAGLYRVPPGLPDD